MKGLSITKKIKTKMLENYTVSVRKGRKDWKQRDTYNTSYTYDVKKDWWVSIQTLYGVNFEITITPDTQCKKGEMLYCTTSSRRDKKTGEILPTFRLLKTITIGEDNGFAILNTSKEQAEEFLDYLSAHINKNSEAQAEQIFANDVGTLKNFVANYTQRLRDDDKKIITEERKLKVLSEKLNKNKEDLRRQRVETFKNYIEDVVDILKKHKFKIPEDLQKELACGKSFTAGVVKHVCKKYQENIEKYNNSSPSFESAFSESNHQHKLTL
jgi:hypothetical protein